MLSSLSSLSSLSRVYVHCIQGNVVAFDKTSPKVAKLRENVKRFGLSCVQCFVFDATKALRDDGHLLGTACERIDTLKHGHC